MSKKTLFNLHICCLYFKGIISTKAVLDREIVSTYHLLAAAVDGGGLSCVSEFHITVTDVNDNPPTFLLSHYVVTTMENSDKITLLARVTAIDPDLGMSRKVVYSLKPESAELDGTFDIDRLSGVVSLLRGLDRETQASYNITIVATDHVRDETLETAYKRIVNMEY